MSSDRELLQRYLRDDDQAAFAELVKSHVSLVYSLAFQWLGRDSGLAQEASQSVFTLLAAKPPPLSRAASLSGWLYRTTRNTVLHIRRKEFRRQNYETKAFDMNALLTDAEFPGTAQIPEALISGALETLNEEDREAVLMRFFQSRSFAAIGSTLSISEDAARMKVERALGKIRRAFSARGVASSVAAVEAALANQVIEAPAGLAASIANGVSAGRIALAVAGKSAGLFSLPGASSIAWLAGAVVVGGGAAWVFQNYKPDSGNHAEGSLGAANSMVGSLQPGDEVSTVGGASQSMGARAKLVKPPSPLAASVPPITGVAKFIQDGKEVDQRVTFIVGKETRINGDACYFLVILVAAGGNEIHYAIKTMMEPPDGGPPRLITNTGILSTPWEGFTAGYLPQSFTFVPDATGPQKQ